MIGDLDKYLKYNAAESLGSGSGSSASAMEMGIGLAVGQQMSRNLQQTQAPDVVTHATPPPLPIDQWHIVLNAEATGPHAIVTIKAMVQEKVISAETLVWRSGMSEWQSATENPIFNALLEQISGHQPPPVPTKS
jgi:hypothetical protein